MKALQNPFESEEDENIVESYDFTASPSFVKGNNFQKSKSLSAAENTLSGQLADIQNKMEKVRQRREELGESQAAQAEKARLNILTADLQDAANTIGGIGSSLGSRERQEFQRQEEGLQREKEALGQELSGLEGLERQMEASQVGLLEKEEEQQALQQQQQNEFEALQAEQMRIAELNDPSSQASQQARQELAFLGIEVPENFSASQIESNKELLLEAEKQRQKMGMEQLKHERDLQVQLMKEERDLQKQLMMSDRKDAATLGQAQKRRSEGTMDSYFQAKDAIDLVKRGGLAENPNQATDASLLEGYERLLRNQATSLDDEGRPIVNKTLLDQANSKIKVWQQRIKGNKGLLTPEDRKALVKEAQNLYEVEQGFNVKRLKNIVDWSDRMSEKNPNIDAGFIVPGIDREILEREMQEFFPEGDVYMTTEQRLGGAVQQTTEKKPDNQRKKFVPGQGIGSTSQGSSGRKIFGR